MPFWSVARVQPRREAYACGHLTQRGYSTLLPLVANGHGAPAALFVAYVLVHITGQWHSVNSTPGVHRLICFGDRPARMPDREVDAIRARMNGAGLVVLPPKPRFKLGDPVMVTGGVFCSQLGVYDGMGSRQRVMVLMQILGAERRLALDAAHLAPL
jgi:transcriptional antiterminator RfaH